MANELTPYINNLNVENVRRQIIKKKGYNPYLSTTKQAVQVLTDYDTFPYPRYFRGIPDSSQPVIAEREAGWRVRHDNCYKVSNPQNKDSNYPNHCFQGSCSGTFPCYPEYLTKYADKELLDTILNNSCIVQYR
jgi:hypothetical protein